MAKLCWTTVGEAKRQGDRSAKVDRRRREREDGRAMRHVRSRCSIRVA